MPLIDGYCDAGDEAAITIGDNTNLQDNTSVRSSKAFLGGHNGATTIGSNVTVGHSVLLDSVTIEDEALIGMGATLLEGVKVLYSFQAHNGMLLARCHASACHSCVLHLSHYIQRVA